MRFKRPKLKIRKRTSAAAKKAVTRLIQAGERGIEIHAKIPLSQPVNRLRCKVSIKVKKRSEKQ